MSAQHQGPALRSQTRLLHPHAAAQALWVPHASHSHRPARPEPSSKLLFARQRFLLNARFFSFEAQFTITFPASPSSVSPGAVSYSFL